MPFSISSNKAFIFVILSITITNNFVIHAQNNELEYRAITYADSLINSFSSNRDYIVILNQLLNKYQYRGFRDYEDMLSWIYSQVGHDRFGIKVGDQFFNKKPIQQPIELANYYVANAEQVISNIARSSKIIMINEEHRNSGHRLLTSTILLNLNKIGYKYLAIESLSKDDPQLIHKFKGPTVLNGTVYLKDPRFGNLIRCAIKIGYKLIPYEAINFSDSVKNLRGTQRQMWREETQAFNLLEAIKNDPTARMVVHGGRDHIAEVYTKQKIDSDSIYVGMMGGALKLKSGIDPLTIDQLRNTVHEDTLMENSIFKWSKTQNLPDQFSVLLNKEDSIPLGIPGLYDISVISKSGPEELGRPYWLWSNPELKKYVIEVGDFQPKKYEYYMVQAIYYNEDHELAIPADMYAYQRQTKSVLLCLLSGTYIFRILNEEGKVLRQYKKRV